MRLIRQFAVACGILTICSCSGSDSEEVEKLKRELDAAKAEAATARAELANLKASMNPHARSDVEETQVLEFGKAFVADVEQNRLTSAYRSTDAAYQQRVERQAFDAMIEELGVRQLEAVAHHEHKVRKSSDGTGYDFYCTARELNSRNPAGPRAFFGDGPGVGPRINFALTVRSEAGGWKASTVEIMVAEEN